MKHIILVSLVVVCSFVVHSKGFAIVRDEYGQEYLIVRQKRDTTIDVQGQGSKATGLTLGHSGSLDIGGTHSVQAGGLVQHNVGGPKSVGGQVGYSHHPSGTSVTGTVVKTPSFGHDVSIGVNKNIINQGGARLDAFAGAQQHFGGIPGNQRPQGNVGIKFEYRPPVRKVVPHPLPPNLRKHACMQTSYKCW